MKKENLEAIIQLRHHLHGIAELSGEETHTKECLMAYIRQRTDFRLFDRGKWFYCRKDPAHGESSMSPIAFRADMDALPIPETISLPYASRTPGVSHKCGHDGHCAALAGLALELTGAQVSRPVVLIFQHAEETGKGGQECAELIPALGISEIYAFHNLSGYPRGSIVVRDGLTQPASKGLTVHFLGKPSHASYPEEGINPSNAVADLEASIRPLLAAPHKGMTLCTVVNMRVGTKDFGVSAGEGEISMTLRAEHESDLDFLESAIRQKAAELAERDNLVLQISVSDPFPETRNDSGALRKVISCAEHLNLPVVHMSKLWRASEDFGWYLHRCPGAIFYIGNGEDAVPLHCEGYDFHDDILETAADMFKELVLS